MHVETVLSDHVGVWRTWLGTRDLVAWLLGDGDPSADAALTLLLRGMAFAFMAIPDYRKNIEGFTARYAFQTKDLGVWVTADFANGEMHVDAGGYADPQVTVVFYDAAALRSFLLRQDIVDALERNAVALEGNVNYAWRFMFLVNDLLHRLPHLEAIDWEAGGT